MSGRDEDYEVGYRKPPKHTRFKPGQSGNPAGRKAKAKAAAPAPLHPTRDALVRRASRLVSIVEDGKRHKVTTREAVIAAMFLTALKGGVLAQRTLLQLMQDEDEREYAERRAAFDYWRDYVRDAHRTVRKAKALGHTAPVLQPHPDDVLLDYETLGVRIVGPISDEEALAFDMTRRAVLMCFEMSLYHGEDVHLDPDEFGRSRMGFWFVQQLALLVKLPPSMRMIAAAELADIEARFSGRRLASEAHLRAECEALGVPFVPKGKSAKSVELQSIFSPVELQQVQAALMG